MTRYPLKLAWTGALLCALSTPAWPQEQAAEADTLRQPARPWEVIEVALVLDTSQSMQALIDTARLELWEVVNDFHGAEPVPTLRVALLTFGNGKSKPGAGWIQVESDLTEDLDRISERLFALTSEGGTEYVGRVLQAAVEKLSWTESHDALKLVFVAGNEPADQDPEVSFREMGDLARREGIFVQAIYCGGADAPDAETWKELAELAEGGFATIDHRTPGVATSSPFDEELAALGAAMTDTYIPLGQEGRERLQSRTAQDRNALEASAAAAAARALTKSTWMESSSWDLVDAVEASEALLYELDERELPESMRGMSFEERELYVEEKRLERQRLRERILELAAARRELVGAQTAARSGDPTPDFDSVVRRTIREKAEERGFRFPEQ